MNRKMWSGAIAVLVFTAATALALAGFPSGNSQIGHIESNPPSGDECVCPAIYQPVVCKGADGSRHTFSSLCVAGCSGYTHCESVERVP